MTPTQRIAAILRLLNDAPDGLVASAAVKEAVGACDGSAGERKFRRDLAWLKDRGCVVSGLSTERTPNRTGIRRRRVVKQAYLQLTSGEHRALARARQWLRPAPPWYRRWVAGLAVTTLWT